MGNPAVEAAAAAQASCVSVVVADVWNEASLTLEAAAAAWTSRTGAVLRAALFTFPRAVLGASMSLDLPGSEAAAAGAAVAACASRVGVDVAGVRSAASLTLEIVAATQTSHTGAVLGTTLASRPLVVLRASMSPSSEAPVAGAAATAWVSRADADVAGVRSAASLALEVAAAARTVSRAAQVPRPRAVFGALMSSDSEAAVAKEAAAA